MSSISILKLRERCCCFKVTGSRRGIKAGVKLLLIINVSVLVLKPQVEFLGRLLPPAPPVCKHLFVLTQLSRYLLWACSPVACRNLQCSSPVKGTPYLLIRPPAPPIFQFHTINLCLCWNLHDDQSACDVWKKCHGLRFTFLPKRRCARLLAPVSAANDPPVVFCSCDDETNADNKHVFSAVSSARVNNLKNWKWSQSPCLRVRRSGPDISSNAWQTSPAVSGDHCKEEHSWNKLH